MPRRRKTGDNLFGKGRRPKAGFAQSRQVHTSRRAPEDTAARLKASAVPAWKESGAVKQVDSALGLRNLGDMPERVSIHQNGKFARGDKILAMAIDCVQEIG